MSMSQLVHITGGGDFHLSRIKFLKDPDKSFGYKYDASLYYEMSLEEELVFVRQFNAWKVKMIVSKIQIKRKEAELRNKKLGRNTHN